MGREETEVGSRKFDGDSSGCTTRGDTGVVGGRGGRGRRPNGWGRTPIGRSRDDRQRALSGLAPEGTAIFVTTRTGREPRSSASSLPRVAIGSSQQGGMIEIRSSA